MIVINSIHQIHIKPIFINIMLLLAVIHLSGCSLLIENFRDPDTKILIITPKKNPINSINDIQINTDDLTVNELNVKEQETELRIAIIEALKEHEMYDPNDKNAAAIYIKVRRLDDNLLFDNAIHAYIEVKNNKGVILTRGALVITNKGFQQIGYIRNKFAEKIVSYLSADPE